MIRTSKKIISVLYYISLLCKHLRQNEELEQKLSSIGFLHAPFSIAHSCLLPIAASALNSKRTKKGVCHFLGGGGGGGSESPITKSSALEISQESLVKTSVPRYSLVCQI